MKTIKTTFTATDSQIAGLKHPTRDLLALAAVLLLYLLLPSRNYLYADDTKGWAFGLARESGIISNHHLFLDLLRPLYRLLAAVAPRAPDPAEFLSAYSAIWGAIGLWSLYRLLHRLGCGAVALPGTLVCAFTAGYWTYSIIGDVYVPATSALVLGSYLFLRDDLTSAARIGGAATAFIVMILHHQAYAWYVGGLALAYALLGRPVLRSRLCQAGGMFALSAAVSLAIYLVFYIVAVDHEQKTFVSFVSGYVDAANYTLEPDQESLSLRMLAKAASGELRAIFPYYALFKSAALSQSIQALFPYRAVYPYPYLVESMTPAEIALVGGGVLLAASAGLALAANGFFAILRERGDTLLLLVATLPQALFFIWWLGLSDEFWIWSLPFLALLAAKGAVSGNDANAAGGSRWSRLATPAALRSCAAGLFVCTLFGAVFPFADPNRDLDTVNCEFLPLLTSKDLLLGLDRIQPAYRSKLAQLQQGFDYMNLFERANRWSREDFDELTARVDRTLAGGGTVYVGPYLARPPTANLEWIRQYNPVFAAQRMEILQRLRSLGPERMVWLPLRAESPGYFER